MSEEVINQAAQKLKKELKRFDDIIQNEKEYDDNDTKKIQLLLNKIFKSTKDTTLQSNKNASIIYEMQALIYWLDGNIDEAVKFARKASTISTIHARTTKDLLGKNITNRLTKLKLWTKRHKKILMIVAVILTLLVSATITLSTLSLQYKKSGESFMKKADSSYGKAVLLYHLGVISKDEEHKELATSRADYKNALNKYLASRKFFPFYINNSTVDQVEKQINKIDYTVEYDKELDSIETAMQANNDELALNDAYKAISYAQKHDISPTDAYLYLATILQFSQKEGDSADPIISALNQSYDNKLNKTIAQIIANNIDVNSTGLNPRILVVYGTSLEIAGRNTEAIAALNYAANSLLSDSTYFIAHSKSYIETLQAETYYFLSLAYCKANNYDKALENINLALTKDPSNETMLKLKNAITSL